MEYWDVCDSGGNKLGYQKCAEEEFLQDEYHVGASLWIADPKGRLLIQKRAASKKTGPNLWSITGGKVRAGESSADACLREVREEIGLFFDSKDIHFLYRSTGSNYLYDDYIVIVNPSLHQMVLDQAEVSQVKWASIKEICDLYEKSEFMYNRISDLSKVEDYLKKHL